ncbi:hypothetical protein ST37_05980 [Vibrio sp. qd031]|uniref:site-specific integrase n=1 Tax=Vibrio sp. qd031 TaxID=1603038 RepID=UPI000A0FE07C|nr:site-specific integrase [Vibrio sp. qd031]ORT50945.1 hypothetical protein ST37_05980 [Vibrio sp. qd031]
MAQKPVKETKLPTGVEIHGNSIRISFSLKGKRCRETLNLTPNSQNIKHAKLKRDAILHEIAFGNFEYGKHFPLSKHAGGKHASRKIEDLAIRYLEYKDIDVRRSTLQRKNWALRQFVQFFGRNRSCDAISPLELTEYRKAMSEGLCGTTINNNLVTIKAFLKWAHEMEFVDKDYSPILKRVKNADPEIEPFSFEEIDAALANCKQEQHRNIVTTFVYTGIRTSELAALAWEDVDFEEHTIKVRRSAYTDRGLKTTKTDTERIVDLLPPVVVALKSQYELTGNLPSKPYDVELQDKSMRREHLHFVFNPKVVRRQKGSDWDYYGTRGLGKIWESMCLKAGVKHRKQYQLRHTYASWMITHANVNINYLAKQMGHKNINMITAIYGKWLDEANKRESARVWEELKKVHNKL